MVFLLTRGRAFNSRTILYLYIGHVTVRLSLAISGDYAKYVDIIWASFRAPCDTGRVISPAGSIAATHGREVYRLDGEGRYQGPIVGIRQGLGGVGGGGWGSQP